MKKLFAGILSGALLLGGVGVLSGSFVAYAEEPPAVNTETANDINTFEQLKTALAKDSNDDGICDYSSIKLTGDITTKVLAADGTTVLNYKDFDIKDFPVFKGTLDGDGYSIDSLKISSTDTNQIYFGLVPNAQDAVIKNLKLKGDLVINQTNMADTVFVGGFVGSGRNTLIDNCEIEIASFGKLDVETKDIAGTPTEVEVVKNFSIDRDLHLGLFAGHLEGKSGFVAMQKCVSYYGEKYGHGGIVVGETVNVEKTSNIRMGGLVGSTDEVEIRSSLNFGNFTVSFSPITEENGINQYFGGIVGLLQGQGAAVKNCVFAGVAQYDEFSLDSSYLGAIVGGTKDINSEEISSKVNYSYYTQSEPVIAVSGDASIKAGTNLQKLSAFNSEWSSLTKAVLETKTIEGADESKIEVFDGALPKFDFQKDWQTTPEGRILLQRFQTFEFSMDELNFEILQNKEKVIKDVYFNGHDDPLDPQRRQKKFRYGEPVLIHVYTDGLKGWLENLTVSQNTNTPVNPPITPIPGATGCDGWEVTLEANASTMGKYSFGLSPKTFNIDVSVANDLHGGIYWGEKNNDSIAVSNLHNEFNCFNQEKDITAKPKGIYAFAGWGYQLPANGVNDAEDADKDGYKDEVIYPALATEEQLKIRYDANNANISYDDTAKVLTIGQEVRLIAKFDENPAKVSFNLEKAGDVIAITMAGNDYTLNGGEPLKLAKSGTVALKITVRSGFELNVEELKIAIKNALEDSTNFEFSETFESEPLQDTQGNTTYTFNVDMSQFNYNVSEVVLVLTTERAKDSGGSNLLWLAITLPCVVVVGVGIFLTIWLLRRKKYGKGGGKMRGGKGGGSKGKTPPANAKVEDYTDYYV